MNKLLRLPAALFVLGGGQGCRLGGNKLFLLLNKRPLLDVLLCRAAPLFSCSFLSVAKDEGVMVKNCFAPLLKEFEVTIVPDKDEEIGPLSGFAAMLEALAPYDEVKYVFLTGCDMPLLQPAVVDYLWKNGASNQFYDIIVPTINKHVEPLHAFYSVKCLETVRRAIVDKRFRFTSFFDNMKVLEICEDEIRHLPGYLKSFMNLNTTDELVKCTRIGDGSFR